ncbi:hypothetical protein, partial [uncultured Vibrio sp.]|uniref:hypothetical protein n=1 Tax=uncultured Vibrio sp. TaxID=114054 RepID=UPI0026082E32
PWQSGYAADCKSVDLGSTPGGASIIQKTSPSDWFFRFSCLLLQWVLLLPTSLVFRTSFIT